MDKFTTVVLAAGIATAIVCTWLYVASEQQTIVVPPYFTVPHSNLSVVYAAWTPVTIGGISADTDAYTYPCVVTVTDNTNPLNAGETSIQPTETPASFETTLTLPMTFPTLATLREKLGTVYAVLVKDTWILTNTLSPYSTTTPSGNFTDTDAFACMVAGWVVTIVFFMLFIVRWVCGQTIYPLFVAMATVAALLAVSVLGFIKHKRDEDYLWIPPAGGEVLRTALLFNKPTKDGMYITRVNPAFTSNVNIDVLSKFGIYGPKVEPLVTATPVDPGGHFYVYYNTNQMYINENCTAQLYDRKKLNEGNYPVGTKISGYLAGICICVLVLLLQVLT